MSQDDDLTVEVDDDVLAEIRQIAQEARANTSSGTPAQRDFDPEATIDGSDDLNEIRRLAAEARADADSTPTPSAASNPPTPVSSPASAESTLAVPPPPPPIEHKPAMPPPPDPSSRIQVPSQGDLRPPAPAVQSQMGHSVPVAKWQPPSRMIAPTDPPKDEAKSQTGYRLLAALLATLLAVVVALVAFGVIGGGSGTSDPGSEGDVPATVDQVPKATP